MGRAGEEGGGSRERSESCGMELPWLVGVVVDMLWRRVSGRRKRDDRGTAAKGQRGSDTTAG